VVVDGTPMPVIAAQPVAVRSPPGKKAMTWVFALSGCLNKTLNYH
jgi:hypothetical protein